MSQPPSVPAAPPADPGAAHLDAAFDLAYYTPLHQHRSAADTKAGALLTASGLMFTLLAHYSAPLAALLRGPLWARLPVAGVLAAFSVLTLLAVVHAFRTISPRFPEAPPSMAFFGDIARLSREEYVAKVEAMTKEEALENLLGYNHTLSSICVEKFQELKIGIRFFEGAAVCWLALIGTALARGAL